MPRAKPKQALTAFRFRRVRLGKGLKQDLLEMTQLEGIETVPLQEQLMTQVEEALSHYVTYDQFNLPRPAHRRADLQRWTPVLGEAAKVIQDLSPFAKADLLLAPFPPSQKRALAKLLQRLPEFVHDLHMLHSAAVGAMKTLGKKESRHAPPKKARDELIRTLGKIFDEYVCPHEGEDPDPAMVKKDFLHAILKSINVRPPRNISVLCPPSN